MDASTELDPHSVPKVAATARITSGFVSSLPCPLNPDGIQTQQENPSSLSLSSNGHLGFSCFSNPNTSYCNGLFLQSPGSTELHISSCSSPNGAATARITTDSSSSLPCSLDMNNENSTQSNIDRDVDDSNSGPQFKNADQDDSSFGPKESSGPTSNSDGPSSYNKSASHMPPLASAADVFSDYLPLKNIVTTGHTSSRKQDQVALKSA